MAGFLFLLGMTLASALVLFWPKLRRWWLLRKERLPAAPISTMSVASTRQFAPGNMLMVDDHEYVIVVAILSEHDMIIRNKR